VEKVLSSAVANAESRPDLHWHGDDLYVAAAFVDEGRTLKRFRPRARGRASAIHKRTCHITVELARTPEALAAEAAAAAARPRRQRAQVETEVVTPEATEGQTPETEETEE
jgi:large subunit ribosomal protein L22